MKTEIVEPVLGNFISSLRDIGYTFEIAVADVLDNSIAASAKTIRIQALAEPEPSFAMFDDGIGMDSAELVEAMRLATRGPQELRGKDDLGRFGLGLKTASFSQCQKLTVISKKQGKVSARCWDLKLLAERNKWILITPDDETFASLPMYDELVGSPRGTLVVWENLDRYTSKTFVGEIDKLRRHVALVFHRFLEGLSPSKRLKIHINNNEVKPFNPFNPDHKATQQLAEESIKIGGSKITIQPFVLPHHSKLSQQDYERYATEEGYTKSQGFYLYRANRLLVYGTWWGLHRAIDAHKLVRIKIEISNDQDRIWGIDIKKSSATPIPEIRGDLSRIIKQVTEKGSRTYSGRGKKIRDKSVIRFWQMLVSSDGQIRFALNDEHPLYTDLAAKQANTEPLKEYLAGIQAFLPLDAIQAQLQQAPHLVDQTSFFTKDELDALTKRLQAEGLDPDFLARLQMTEVFRISGGHIPNERLPTD